MLGSAARSKGSARLFEGGTPFFRSDGYYCNEHMEGEHAQGAEVRICLSARLGYIVKGGLTLLGGLTARQRKSLVWLHFF